MANRNLPEEERGRLIADLMKARREVGKALRAKDLEAEKLARQAVHSAKLGLGERGPPWWSDGAPGYNRRMVRNTPYQAAEILTAWARQLARSGLFLRLFFIL